MALSIKKTCFGIHTGMSQLGDDGRDGRSVAVKANLGKRRSREKEAHGSRNVNDVIVAPKRAALHRGMGAGSASG